MEASKVYGDIFPVKEKGDQRCDNKKGAFLHLAKIKKISYKVEEGSRRQIVEQDLGQSKQAGGQIFFKEKKNVDSRSKSEVILFHIELNSEDVTSLACEVGTKKLLFVLDPRERGILNSQSLWGDTSNMGKDDETLSGQEIVLKAVTLGSLYDYSAESSLGIKDGNCMDQELVCDDVVKPVFGSNSCRGLSVAPISFLKKRKGRKDCHMLKSHSMILRSFSAGAIIQNQDQVARKEIVWNLEEEIAKVFEKGMDLGCEFNGRKKELREMMAMRDDKKDNRFRELVRWLVSNYKATRS
ncbi:hypothetical protein LWI29_024585 [Acer saccharum]|uniref:Uncharacterized protein n=1 Tax=Acer saccharum TaxID=4024 RepID=A0AA39V901_ACESA|nr:hypothetical protein LWI29_024585 [Acer saccharum]